MKKTALFLLLSLLIFSSCSNDSSVLEPTTTDSDLQIISFKLQAFDVSYGDITTRSSQSESGIENVYYFVHHQNSNNQSLVKKKHLTGKNVLEQLNDTLPRGEYYVSILASSAIPNNGTNYYGFIDGLGYSNASIYSMFGTDAFFGTFPLTVGITPVTKSVSLDRIVGRCDIVIEDAQSIPENIESIAFRIRDLSSLLYFASVLPRSATLSSFEIPAIEHLRVTRDQVLASTVAKPLSFYALGGADDPKLPLEMVVTYKKGTFPEGDTKTIVINNGVNIYPNKVTRLSGKLFEPAKNSFQVTINDKWVEGETGTISN